MVVKIRVVGGYLEMLGDIVLVGSLVLRVMLSIGEQKSSWMEVDTGCWVILSGIQLLMVLRRGW